MEQRGGEVIRRMHERAKRFMAALVERVRTFKPKPPSIQGAKRFVVKVAKAAYTAVFDYLKGIWQHWETIVIIILAGVGLTALICEIPWVMTIAIPTWVIAEYIIPVFAAAVIWLLIDLAKWRRNRRMKRTVLVAA
jgi:hypothetical protein